MSIDVIVVHPKLNLKCGRAEVGTKIKVEDIQAKKWIKQAKVKLYREAKSLDATEKK